jgi:hypothetical protein
MPDMTDAEALAEIEELIKRFRYARGMPETSRENRAYSALKMAASEFRAREAGKVPAALTELQRGLSDLEQSRVGRTFSPGCMQHVAMEVRARWTLIRQALMFFEEARKVDAQ